MARTNRGLGVRDTSWMERGPLGRTNYRQQLGRSFELGNPVEKLATDVVYLGATQHTNDPALRGLAHRAAGDSAASLVQVTCTYRSDDATAERPLTVMGKISWGTDGHQAEAFFDWTNGTVVQVSASYVAVVAMVRDVMASADEEPTHDEAQIVTVGALVGYWAANRAAPTFTQQVRMVQTDPPALPTASLAIPRFARRLWWLGPVPTSAVWALGPGAGQTIGQIDPAGLTQRQAYERPGIATHVQLTGNPGAATLNNLVWELVL